MKPNDLCDMNYTACPFIDVQYSLCQFILPQRLMRNQPVGKIRIISIRCVAYEIALYCVMNGMAVSVNNSR